MKDEVRRYCLQKFAIVRYVWFDALLDHYLNAWNTEAACTRTVNEKCALLAYHLRVDRSTGLHVRYNTVVA